MKQHLFGFLVPASIYYVFLITFPHTVIAETETRYISDQLIINLRSSIEKPYKTVTSLKTDDKLEVLEAKGSYVKVHTEEGDEGWIAAQYLISSPPKSQIINSLKIELTALEKKLVNLRKIGTISNSTPANIAAQLQSITTDNDRLHIANKGLIEENELLKAEVSESKNIIDTSRLTPNGAIIVTQDDTIRFDNLVSERNQLQQQLEEISSKYIELENQIKNLQGQALVTRNKNLQMFKEVLGDKRMIYWFFAGAIVFLLGLISGKIIGRKKKRFTY